MPTSVEEIILVLERHAPVWKYECKCGWKPETLMGTWNIVQFFHEHRMHVAKILELSNADHS
jgi:hypothetical protein